MKVKGHGARKASSPDSEPNFYTMSFLPPSLQPLTAMPNHSSLLSFASAMLPITSQHHNLSSPQLRYTGIDSEISSQALLESSVRSLSLAMVLEREQNVARALQVSRFPSSLCTKFTLPHLKGQTFSFTSASPSPAAFNHSIPFSPHYGQILDNADESSAT